MDSIVFTPAAILDLLSQIDELSEYTISLDDVSGKDVMLRIGQSSYRIDTAYSDKLTVSSDVVDNINEINDEAIDDFVDSNDDVESDYIESGIFKQLAKTLLVGGVVRLAAKLLK